MASIFALIIIVVICFVVYAVYKDGQSSGHDYSSPAKSSSKKEGSSKPVTIFTEISSSDYYDTFLTPNISNQLRFHRYKVKGKNPSTNRMKTCIVVALSGTTENEIAEKSGFLAPYSVSLDLESLTEQPPSQKQLNYAKDLDISIPLNCSFADLSCLISKRKGEDTNDLVTNELMTFAASHGVCISPYAGVLSSVCKTMNSLDSRDFLAFLAYLIHCVVSSFPIGNLEKSEYKNVFYKFADSYCDDDEVNECTVFEDTHIRYLLEKKHFDGRNKKKAWLFNLISNFLNEHLTKA
ncbi:hypothetical protein I6E91_24215 [Enterocloster clostridioformis]|uniref:hypothetical protein n=1 Tax=Enterocloster clostridioformis TaxID=1531 RepID=UPI001F2021D6|nr:hypothetical protein [Enterocloster clostridioformis]MCF2705096.1 hypothetical protein [Enterocloster clostridioformis]